MSTSNNLKLELVKALIATEDPETLERVKALLMADGNKALTEEQKAELDTRLQRSEDGKGKEYSWEDVKTMAREALSK